MIHAQNTADDKVLLNDKNTREDVQLSATIWFSLPYKNESSNFAVCQLQMIWLEATTTVFFFNRTQSLGFSSHSLLYVRFILSMYLSLFLWCCFLNEISCGTTRCLEAQSCQDSLNNAYVHQIFLDTVTM